MLRLLIIPCILLTATRNSFCARARLAKRFQPRVYLGTSDIHHEFPFVVSLQMEENRMVRLCSGCLISDTWVLTAGHCINQDDPTIVRYADFTSLPNETEAFVRVIEEFQHPNYRATSFSSTNDNALILTEKVPSPAIGKLSAVDYMALLGLPVKYAGFGLTTKDLVPKNLKDIDVKDVFRPLQVGEGVVIPCPADSTFTPAVCIAPKCSNRLQDTRGGDSGGPLVYDGKIVGVLIGGDLDNGPISYYAPISPNLEWVQYVMNHH